MKKPLLFAALFIGLLCSMRPMGAVSLMSPKAAPDDSLASIVDEVVWVVGDEPILKSDIEVTRIQASMDGVRWSGDPDCAIPEQIAVQKLFLHQAAIDSIDKDITENDIALEIEQRIEYMVEQVGSRETQPDTSVDARRPARPAAHPAHEAETGAGPHCDAR